MLCKITHFILILQEKSEKLQEFRTKLRFLTSEMVLKVTKWYTFIAQDTLLSGIKISISCSRVNTTRCIFNWHITLNKVKIVKSSRFYILKTSSTRLFYRITCNLLIINMCHKQQLQRNYTYNYCKRYVCLFTKGL